MKTLHLHSASILCGVALSLAISGCVTISNNYYPEQSQPAASAANTTASTTYAASQGQCGCGAYHDAHYGYYPPQSDNNGTYQGSYPSPTVIYVPQSSPQYPVYYPPYSPQPTYRHYPPARGSEPVVIHDAGNPQSTSGTDNRGVESHTRRDQPETPRTTDAGRIATGTDGADYPTDVSDNVGTTGHPARIGNGDRIDVGTTGNDTPTPANDATDSRPRRTQRGDIGTGTAGSDYPTDVSDKVETTGHPARIGNNDRIDVGTTGHDTPTPANDATDSRPRRTQRVDADHTSSDQAKKGQSVPSEAGRPSTSRRQEPVSETGANATPHISVPVTAAPVGSSSEPRHTSPSSSDASTATASKAPVSVATRTTSPAPVTATPRESKPTTVDTKTDGTSVSVNTQDSPAAVTSDPAALPVDNAPASANTSASSTPRRIVNPK